VKPGLAAEAQPSLVLLFPQRVPKLAEIVHQAYANFALARLRRPCTFVFTVRFHQQHHPAAQGELYIRVSDLLEGAPESVLHSIAHILLAKLYRKPVDRCSQRSLSPLCRQPRHAAKARLVRQMRGRKHIHSARGHHYHLEEIFDDLNRRFFHGLLGRPQLTWSQNHARSSLGHYDPAHNAIVISRVFDHPRVPPYAVEYILFHEMLHLKHPVRLRGSRRCVHSQEFLADEKMFPELEQARKFLRRVSACVPEFSQRLAARSRAARPGTGRYDAREDIQRIESRELRLASLIRSIRSMPHFPA
jgi:hypothetical protein